MEVARTMLIVTHSKLVYISGMQKLRTSQVQISGYLPRRGSAHEFRSELLSNDQSTTSDICTRLSMDPRVARAIEHVTGLFTVRHEAESFER
jgi:hypothetical protein